MNAREELLGRVRRASANAHPVCVPRAYRRAGEGHAVDLIDLLVERLRDYGAGVAACHDEDVASVVQAAIDRHKARHALVPAGMPERWLPLRTPIEHDLPHKTAAELDAVDAVVTTCVLAIAETGTIVLDTGAGMGRRALTLVPDMHVVLVRSADIVLGVPEALARLDPAHPLTWISGPSATSDIELDRVEGVHGPRRLEVVLVLGSGEEP